MGFLGKLLLSPPIEATLLDKQLWEHTLWTAAHLVGM